MYPTADPNDFLTVNKMLRERCPDLIVNDTVGGGYLRFDKSDSLGKPYDIAATSLAEVASVDVEGVGQGPIDGPNAAYTITPGEMGRLCDTLLAHNTTPEFECFDIGDFIMVNQMIATAIALGLNIRVGMEDNIYLKRGVRAKSNKELVEKAVALCELLDRRVATPAEAREMMGLGEPRQYE